MLCELNWEGHVILCLQEPESAYKTSSFKARDLGRVLKTSMMFLYPLGGLHISEDFSSCKLQKHLLKLVYIKERMSLLTNKVLCVY